MRPLRDDEVRIPVGKYNGQITEAQVQTIDIGYHYEDQVRLVIELQSVAPSTEPYRRKLVYDTVNPGQFLDDFSDLIGEKRLAILVREGIDEDVRDRLFEKTVEKLQGIKVELFVEQITAQHGVVPNGDRIRIKKRSRRRAKSRKRMKLAA